MTKLTTTTLTALALGVATLCTATHAEAHGGGGDIALFNTNGQTDVGFAELDDDDINQESFDPADSVFQAVLTPINQVPGVQPYEVGSSEPGYDANEAVALLPGQFSSGLPADALVSWRTIGVDYWDGSGSPAFSPASWVDAGYAAPTTGTTDSLGGFHLHPTFGLVRNDSDPLPTGVYLAELAATVDGLTESDPFYLVALVDEGVNALGPTAEAQTLAEDIGAVVRDYLAGATPTAQLTPGGTDYAYYGEAVRYAESLAIPEPASAVIALLGLAGLARCRR